MVDPRENCESKEVSTLFLHIYICLLSLAHHDLQSGKESLIQCSEPSKINAILNLLFLLMCHNFYELQPLRSLYQRFLLANIVLIHMSMQIS